MPVSKKTKSETENEVVESAEVVDEAVVAETTVPTPPPTEPSGSIAEPVAGQEAATAAVTQPTPVVPDTAQVVSVPEVAAATPPAAPAPVVEPVAAPVVEPVAAPVVAAPAVETPAPAPVPAPALVEIPLPTPVPTAPAPASTPIDALKDAGGAMPSVLDPLAALGLPSMLDSALNDAQQQAMMDDNLGDEEGRLSLAYAAFPQGKGEKYRENTKYKVYIGRKEDNPQDAANYFDKLPILYIDSVLIRPSNGKGKPLGGRLMWPTKANGERDLEKGVQCQSLDGITPMPKYIGNDVYDFRTGSPFKIGYTRDLTTGQMAPKSDINICANCPASQWMDINGKKAQLCKSNWSWVVYDVKGDRMVKISGGNAGTQMALEGRDKGSMGSKKDGSALVGIEHYFKQSGTIVKILPATTTLTPLQLTCVSGITTAEGPDSPITPTTAISPDGTKNEAFYNLIASGLVKGIALTIPTYPYAPQGRPEYVGSFEVPVYPVLLSAVPNNFKLGQTPNPTSVPDFELGTEPLTPEEYAGFLRQRSEYHSQDMRRALLGLDMHPRVLEVLNQNAPVQISAPASVGMPQLPSVNVAANSGDEIIEGVFTTPTDVPADA